MERKRIFIAVKTYPTISKKHVELVCTAGVLEDGAWIRLYPVRFRTLDIEQKYPKYAWIEADVERNLSDFRPETYSIVNPESIAVVDRLHYKQTPWNMRKEIIFRNKEIFTNLEKLIILAKTKGTSLAVFKPTHILDFKIEQTEREWPKDTLKILELQSRQLSMFQTPEEIANDFRVADKIPYKFSYRFSDDSGRESTLMIEDWEIGMLYRNCLKNANGDEHQAVEKVRQKYYDYFLKEKDLYFFLGTTREFHNIAPNPFIIVGVFYPPISHQTDFFGLI
jgi:hypothetical protein